MNRIKKLRKEKKLTQQEVADAMGVSRRGFQKWENGDSQLKPDKIQQLANYFEVSEAYLLGYDIGTKPTFDILGNTMPPRELQGYDYTVLDINQDTPEILNEVSKLKYCAIKLKKENEAPLFTGFRAIITDHDREIVIDPISVDTFYNEFTLTDVLTKNGYQSDSPEQFRDFINYIDSRKREDKEILNNILSDWLSIVDIDKNNVSISYFEQGIPTPKKVRFKK
ncbi:helix-turn-helix domain-containing protein [Streptococcus gordonii]|uniref:Helix-turn-helix domain-containing protein n=1 Tax=Streptococcus gordonii TaxID=1302 RepID=A0AB35FVM5_STRGN|nr:helix-turn-helix transcriptional regulator [Streptococcus gordonii]QBX08304.1 HTH-type transcriptional regulator [Streptococcus satellite phage Javan243]MBZ2128022.1 helix-turn-helix domain-containing protein [Streptococcus gordonii]MBZ2129716.1 helix-turn-helix domain-containing protein [Streptococcus gordonii]MBZ2147313.1 helix-turn-helix domain-containing protein [Streptococcus gordonii]RSJ41986.1 HTH-type transcriptional regulator Xre [Streptococcus gordonii]